MKTVYIIGFQGAGIRPLYQHEPPLIQLGHVGVAFDDPHGQILGFHPTPTAMQSFPFPEAAIDWLRQRHTVAGSLQDDTNLFKRAYTLSQHHPHLAVWQFPIALGDTAFERVWSQALTWYDQQTQFPYGLPIVPQTAPQSWDNCATFPRLLGLSLPEPTGHLYLYLKAMKTHGQLWTPEA